MGFVMRRVSIAVLLVAITFVAACSAPIITFDTTDTDYDPDTIANVAQDAQTSAIFGRPVADAEDLRHEALSDLRAQGEEGAEIADILTTQFHSPARSVPYYVESASFEGKDAWVVVEVWGSEGGVLDQVRIWVFDSSHDDVLFTKAVN